MTKMTALLLADDNSIITSLPIDTNATKSKFKSRVGKRVQRVKDALDAFTPDEEHEKRLKIIEESDSFKKLKVEKKLDFDHKKYPFIEIIRSMINIDEKIDLCDWHKTIPNFTPESSVRKSKKELGPLLNEEAQFKGFKLDNDSNEQSFLDIYRKFIKEVIVPHIQEEAPELLFCQNNDNEESESANTDSSKKPEVIIQASPCIRLQPPSTHRMTCPHKDSDYGHQPGQVNFWIPLTEAFDTNSLYAESEPGKKDFRPFNLKIGDFIRFYGNECVHYTLANKTDKTRVSIDFRVVPAKVYDDDFIGSRRKIGANSQPMEDSNAQKPESLQKFKLGGYYERITL